VIGLTPREVCAALAITPAMLRTLRRKGQLTPTMLGHRTARYSPSQVARLLGEPVTTVAAILEAAGRLDPLKENAAGTPRTPPGKVDT
jgi:predicted site-specific integrase-resolvase